MKIIPAIDIIGGSCVRLSQGNYSLKKIYDDNPLDVAKRFEDAGISSLHLVDLDGAKSGSPQNLDVLESIASYTSLIVDFGGGVKSTASLESVFQAGAHAITAGTISVKNNELVFDWISKYGDRIILGADANNGFVAVNGWELKTEMTVFDLIKNYEKSGLQRVICTDISKDGMLDGPSFGLYKKLIQAFPKMKFVASGGVSSIEDLKALKDCGLYGAIVGKAIYEGKISLKDLARLC